jgi:hypothetical protein
MTSIEWLISKLGISEITHKKLFEQAKKIHKQEIIDAYNKSFELRDKPYSTADKYYQETFVSKGSDDKNYTENYTDNYPELDGINNLIPKQRIEISDEEIEKAANEHFEGDLMWSERIAFKLAIRWYREQLKLGASQEK